MHFSKFYSLGSQGHQNLDFVDILLETDLKLYIDPSLIQGTHTEWCQKCHLKLKNYFDAVFNGCRSGNDFELMKLLQHGGEPNETKLGMSANHSQGRGNSPELLYGVFKGIDAQTLGRVDGILNPMDLCVCIDNFAEDRLSDLATNVLRKELYEFTVDQCKKHGIPLATQPRTLGAYWNSSLGKWDKLVAPPLITNGEAILLVPKNIVRHRYVYSTEQYISQFVIPARQKYHLDNLTSLAQPRYSKKHGDYYVKPPKKLVRQSEIPQYQHKLYARNYISKNPASIIDFRDSIMDLISEGKYTLTDYQLDYFVYIRSVKIS